MTPNGILVLTTPNADLIDRRAPLGLLVAMLSPELHAIIHSEKSVHQLLTSVGFSHVSIEARGSSLVAYASDLPYSLNVPEITIRSDLRRHLELQANQHFADRDLFIGYAGRCLLECANDRDIERGRRIRRVLGRYIRLHFDIDIEAIELPPPKVESCSLEEMAELVPLNLASILYAMSMIDLFSGVSRSELRHRFRLAGVLARQLRRATGELAMEDVLSEDLAWLCSSEEMLCAAATGDAGIVVELEKLRQSNEFRSVGRMNSIIIRSFIELVHGGHSEVAEKLVPMVSDVSEVDLALLRELRFCRGILELNSRRDASLAVGHFAMVRQLFVGTLPDELYWSALRGEFQALDRQGNHEQLSELCREIVSITSHAVDKVPRDLAVRLQYN